MARRSARAATVDAMPEGDSLHRAARRLQVLVDDRVEAESPHPRGLATGVAAAVDGLVLESVEAVGKHLLLRFEGGVVLRSHLRMNGRWRVTARDGPVRGRPWLVLRGGEWQATQWNGPVLALDARPVARLGSDLLAEETDVGVLVGRLRAGDSERLVGEALVDQRVVSGIGNMWLAESLWHERVSPWSTVEDVTDEELRRVLAHARTAMRASVTGSRPRKAAHRRAGHPCPRCGAPIRSRGLGDANRTAYWCPGCQPVEPPVSDLPRGREQARRRA
jgi:endonuclease VIII